MVAKLLKVIQLTILLIIVIPNYIIACSCFPYEPLFCRATGQGNNIIMGVVTGHPDFHLMDFKLIENINKVITEDTLLIYGQDGLFCGELLTQFNVNDTLILATVDWEINGIMHRYLEGTCGLHFLRYQNQMVVGPINDTLTTQSLEEFRDNIFTCLDMPLPLQKVESLEQELTLFPNPTAESFQVNLSEDILIGYEVYNSNGQLVSSRDLTHSVKEIEVNLGDHRKGIYYIRIKTPKGILTRKLIKI